MVCLACQAITSGRLCPHCRSTVRPAADRLLPGGIRLVAAFEHDGAARTLVHHLKYRGVAAYADLVAVALADRIEAFPIVPVPRALTRCLKYGVDPARVLAGALGRRLGVPVIDALRRPIHAPRRAGRDHSREVHPLQVRQILRFPVVVVDDVVTTGATALAAVEAVGPDLVSAVAAANVVPKMSKSDRRVTGPKVGRDGAWRAF